MGNMLKKSTGGVFMFNWVMSKLTVKEFKNNLIVTYMLFLLTPIVLTMIFFYSYVYRYMEEELIATHEQSLKVFQTNADHSIANCRKMMLDMVTSDAAIGFFLDHLEEDRYKNAESEKALLNISAIYNSHSLGEIDSIYIYDAKDEIVLYTPQRYRSSIERFHDAKFLKEALKQKGKGFTIYPSRYPFYEGYLEQLTSIEYRERFNGISKNRKVLTFAFNIEMYQPRYKGIIAVNFYDDVLNYGIDNEHYLIVQDGEIISSSYGENLSIQPLMNHIEGERGHFTTTIGGEQTIVAYEYSGDTGLLYMKLAHVSLLYKEVRSITLAIVVIYAFIILVGLFLSYKKSMKLSEPVKIMLGTLSERIEREPSYKRSQLGVLSDTVNTMSREFKTLANWNETHKKNLQNKQVLDVFKGNDSIVHSLFEGEPEFYTVLILSIDWYMHFKQKYSRDEQWYYKALVLNIAEKQVNESCIGKGAVLQDGMVGVIVAGDGINENDFRERLKGIVRKLKRQFDVIEELSISISIGNIYMQDEFIYDSYSEAKDTLQYRMLCGTNAILFAEYYKDGNREYYDTTCKRNHLLNYMESGYFDKVYTLIQSIGEDLRSNYTMRREGILQVYYAMASVGIRYLESHNALIENYDYNSIYNRLAQDETLDELEKDVMELFKGVEKSSTDDGEKEDSKFESILKVIEENYADVNFNIKILAKEVGISYPQVNRILQKNMNKGYIQYITSIRINKAKELLVSDRYKIEDISLKVGYYNSQSFTRNFKKLEGITPSEYRRRLS